MDEISFLRRVRSDVPERSREGVTAGRAALFEAINDTDRETTRQRPGGTRRGRWVAATAVAGVTAVVGVVAVSVVGIDGRGGADPAAASVLEDAASATLRFDDPVVEEGQYLLVKSDGVFAGAGYLSQDTAAYFFGGVHSELYVPADVEEDWIWIQCAAVPVETFGDESEQLVDITTSDDVDMFRRAPGGALYEDANLIGNVDYAALPRDPDALLDRIYELTTALEGGPAGKSRDGAALTFIADTLRVGTVPADLRAALYRAAAKIPGVTITADQARLNGTTGIAVGRLETEGNLQQDIILDPDTGQFIGEREIAIDGDDILPPGTITTSTAVTTHVVDTAPTDSASCETRR
ncbi:CU044_5270 family protein [Microbacterium sp. SSW1-59]|uniref:CU044_5270 family protein n=1 Tax=Microbacterium xanthum TaxID=3079794 RepID=UPI002AD49CBD|nr:CU044_5270 family protein [Microbacterium sp. SSW1-59]MDZ8202692.1 CU044_5270 family protein [Microbacterium sp. SSW1-59]